MPQNNEKKVFNEQGAAFSGGHSSTVRHHRRRFFIVDREFIRKRLKGYFGIFCKNVLISCLLIPLFHENF
jgi:hypothetical protein